MNYAYTPFDLWCQVRGDEDPGAFVHFRRVFEARLAPRNANAQRLLQRLLLLHPINLLAIEAVKTSAGARRSVPRAIAG